MSQAIDPQILGRFQTQDGLTLEARQQRAPVLVVFLRHMGCTFCRQALADLAALRPEFAAAGTELVVVHMSPESEAREVFAAHGLPDTPRISDPERTLYAAFGLAAGSLMQVAGPQIMLRGLRAVLKHGLGVPKGNLRQLQGTFLIHRGQILRAFRNRSSADQPDYRALMQPPGIPA